MTLTAAPAADTFRRDAWTTADRFAAAAPWLAGVALVLLYVSPFEIAAVGSAGSDGSDLACGSFVFREPSYTRRAHCDFVQSTYGGIAWLALAVAAAAVVGLVARRWGLRRLSPRRARFTVAALVSVAVLVLAGFVHGSVPASYAGTWDGYTNTQVTVHTASAGWMAAVGVVCLAASALWVWRPRRTR